ncbi:HAD-IIB family hydrolase [Rhizobium sp. LjRoot98]|uniref:HAD-IIB family hydrolase n=1 Tax=Rhizobium sp. LjRoot98 TaxID=3342345 RepID=UPI003ED0C014
MKRQELTKVRLFAADLDGTLVGDREAEACFFEAWTSIEETRRPLLVYNSGRLLDDIRRLLPATNLPPAEVLIGGVGTMLLRFSCLGDGNDYTKSFSTGFDWAAIEDLLKSTEPRAELQPIEHQSEYKSSWYLQNAQQNELHNIETTLSAAGLRVKLVYSSNRDLDVLPLGVDKGTALVWLCRRLHVDLDEVLVAGDTNNDRGMLELPGIRGIVVSNARDNLKIMAQKNPRIFCASAEEARGVIEGLHHFGVLESRPEQSLCS